MPKVMGQERYDRFMVDRYSHSLTWLAKYFGSDKAGPLHRYTRHYQMFFEPMRQQEIVLLEIGIGGYSRSGEGGASLRMWKQFFPKAQIVGLDLQDKRFVEEERIRVFQGDQSDPKVLQGIVDEVGRPHIVIDDGSHRSPHVLASFEVLFPLLHDGGWYVIEDTQSSYWPEWQGAADRNASGTTMALVKNLVDGLNWEEFVDEPYEPTYTDLNVTAVHCFHNLVFIKKGRNKEGTYKKRILKQRYAETPAAASAPAAAAPKKTPARKAAPRKAAPRKAAPRKGVSAPGTSRARNSATQRRAPRPDASP